MRRMDEAEQEGQSVIFVCRIRKPLEAELSRQQQLRSRTKSTTSNKNLFALNPDFEYSIFSTAKEGSVVLATEEPILGSEINKKLIATTDAQQFVESLKKRSNEDAMSMYAFNSVANETVNQEQFYNLNMRKLAKETFEASSATVIAYGPTGYI